MKKLVELAATAMSASLFCHNRGSAAKTTCYLFVCLLTAIAGVGDLSAETYSWTGASDDDHWSTLENWSGETLPTSADTIRPPVAPDSFIVDLENETRTVSTLDFTSVFASSKYPSIEVRNGTLVLMDGLNDPTGNASTVDSGVMTEAHTCPFDLVNATLRVHALFKSGRARQKGYMFSVGDGSSLILDHVNLYDKFTWIKVLPGGTADFTFDTTVQKNGDSTSRSTWSNEGGTFTFPGGFTLNRTATSGWSKRASFRLQQKSGVMNLGGNVSLGNSASDGGWAMGLFFQWFGGTVHAVSNVTFNVDARYQYGSSEVQESFIQSNSVVTAEVDSGKTMDMSSLDLRDGVSLTKTGAGLLSLARVPHSLSIDAGTISFSDNTRTTMRSLRVGTGASYTLVHSGMMIETLEDNAGTITIEQPGLSIGALGAEATLSGAFAFMVASFVEGNTIVTTPDATLRAKIKADAETAFESSGAAIIESGNALVVGAPTFIFDSTSLTDLNDPAGWQSGLPAPGSDVIVAGAGVNAVISADLSNVWNSITVQDGASMHIASAGLSLPSIVLRGEASLTVAADFAAASLMTSAVGDAFPTLAVTDGATLTLPAGYKFSNVHLILSDSTTLTESGDGPLVFGYAMADETAYFAMHATNATITALDSTGSSSSVNGSSIGFASPASGGTVVVVNDIVLKGCTFTYNQYDGFAFGRNNPTSQTFKVIADGTELDFGATSYVAGSAHLVLTNGNSILFRRRRKKEYHDGESENIYSLFIQQRGRITAVAGGEIRASITDKRNVDQGVIGLNPDDDGYVGIELLDGGIGCWYKAYSSNGKGTIRFKNGVQRVFCGNWWSYGNRNRLFNGMKSVDIDAGSTMTLCGVTDLFGDNAWNLGPFELEAPFGGAGDLVITNTTINSVLKPILTKGVNACTGELRVETCAGGASAKLYVANGANWAGTAIANGKLELANAAAATPAHNSPVAVSFGALDLQADFPVKVWKPDGEPMTNDTLNVGTYLNNGGRLVLELATDGVEFSIGDSVVVGKIAKDGALPRVPAGWVAKKQAIDGDDANDDLILKRGTGLQVLVR